MLLVILLVASAVLAVPPLASAAPATPSVSLPPPPLTSFDSSPYRSLDLARAARDEYGPTATVVSVGNHLFDWRAQVWGRLKPLDLERAVRVQFGVDWSLVTVGVGRNDWKALNISTLNYVVLPVMEVASDQWFDVVGVSQGLSGFRSVLSATRNWYKARAGRTFRLVQPIVIATDKTSAEWNAISASTEVPGDDPDRMNLLNELKRHYEGLFPLPGSRLAVAAAPYSGNSPDVWLGAADAGRFAIAPPRATSVTCPFAGTQDARCGDAEYALGHELGHAFGLAHSCDAFPDEVGCQNSIMQTGKPWTATLLQQEIDALKTSPFLH